MPTATYKSGFSPLFGARLRERRLEEGLSLRAAAASIGIFPSHLHRMEVASKRLPTPRVMDKICTTLDLTRAQLFGMACNFIARAQCCATCEAAELRSRTIE